MEDPTLRKKKMRNAFIWVLTVSISALIILFGNYKVTAGLNLFNNSEDTVKAQVISIEMEELEEYSLGGEEPVQSIYVTFIAEVLDGDKQGELVIASQSIDGLYGAGIKKVDVGDKVVLLYREGMSGVSNWFFTDYYRFGKMIGLAAVFFALVLILGRGKGVNTLISLVFTCAFIFLVFVPSVLNGYNIYITSSLTCIYTIIMTLLLINGVSKKSFTTILGCIFGVIVAGLFTVVMDKVLILSGFTDEHSIYLQMIDPAHPIDLKAIIFGSIIIGTLGAVMDVAMDISSSLYEIKQNSPDILFVDMVKSGLAIGRDIMGTMANTLVLAYIGSSMCSTLLLFTYTSSLTDLLNRESIIVEILQALTGSTAILLTIPLTVFVCALLYAGNTLPRKKTQSIDTTL